MLRTRTTTVFVAALTIVCALAVIVTAGRASALHLALSKSQPMKDSTVTVAPATVQLWFTESVKAATTSVRIMGADSAVVATDAVTVNAEAKAPAVATFKAPLKPGKYKVMWRTLGADSHAITGEFSFTFRPAQER